MQISDKAKELLEQFDGSAQEFGFHNLMSGGSVGVSPYLSAKADLVQSIASLEHKALVGTSGQDFGKDCV
jgi:hypothetical protein